MKKVIVTACVAVLAAAAAQAQSWGTAGDINRFGQEYLAKQKKSEQRLITQQADKQSRELAKEVERQALLAKYKQAAKAKKANNSCTSADKKESGSCPHYYYGREGKMMALGELTHQLVAKRKAAKAKAKANPAPKKVDVVKEDEEGEKTSWWKAIFLGGRYPGESKEAYRARLAVRGYPCNQPFK